VKGLSCISFSNNGGDSIHHEWYYDNDFTSHFDDWVVDVEQNIFAYNEDVLDLVSFDDNKGLTFTDEEQDKDIQEENEGKIGHKESSSILIEDIHATADDPYIIEGYEISNPDGNCIEVQNSSYIVIRGNYLHDCGYNLMEKEEDHYPHYDGLAIKVGNSKHVIIENNEVIDNLNGILAYNCPYTIMRNNTIKEAKVWCALHCEICDNSEFYDNYLSDNGVPEWFWHPGHRISALYILRSNNVKIHDNTVIRSTSDGIRVIAQIEGGGANEVTNEWGATFSNVSIYNNLVLDNMELGFALDRGRNMKIYNNTVRATCTGPVIPIAIEFDVDDSEFYNNKLTPCGNPYPMGISTAQRNHIYNNTAYYFDNRKEEFVPQESYDDQGDKVKSGWAGIPYEPSADNIIEDNKWKKIGGELADILRESMETAHENDLFIEHGWFSCEITEGVFDEDCVEEEKAKGVQGKDSKYLIIEPLYPDSEEFVIEETFFEKFPVGIIIIVLVLIIMVFVTLFLKRKYKNF
jgi:parallel beta-helix repeat protein